jgi:hypothetical protein
MSVSVYPSGQPSFGTLLKRGNAGCPETFTTIANVGDITGPSPVRAKNKTTSHSTSIPWDTYIPSIIDPGVISFPLYVKTDSVDHRQLMSDFQEGTFIDWQLLFPDAGASLWSFSGYFSKFAIKSTVAGVTMVDAEIQISGFVDMGF